MELIDYPVGIIAAMGIWVAVGAALFAVAYWRAR